MMGNRSTLIVFLVLLLIIIILAQNGSLGNIFSSNGGSSGIFGAPDAPSGNPFGFSTAVPNSGFIMPTAFLPTAYIPPAYAPTLTPVFAPNPNPNPINNNAAPPVGVMSSSGQCIVPNGWRPYTIQAGETLAGIAAVFNLTANQLASANCMTNPDLIYEGQVIAVP